LGVKTQTKTGSLFLGHHIFVSMMIFERWFVFGHHFSLPKFQFLQILFTMVAFNFLLVVLLDLLHSMLVLRGDVAQVLQANVVQRIMMRSVKTMGGFFLFLFSFLFFFLSFPCLIFQCSPLWPKRRWALSICYIFGSLHWRVFSLVHRVTYIFLDVSQVTLI